MVRQQRKENGRSGAARTALPDHPASEAPRPCGEEKQEEAISALLLVSRHRCCPARRRHARHLFRLVPVLARASS